MVKWTFRCGYVESEVKTTLLLWHKFLRSYVMGTGGEISRKSLIFSKKQPREKGFNKRHPIAGLSNVKKHTDTHEPQPSQRHLVDK